MKRIVLLAMAWGLLTGCSARKVSMTSRTAIEQLLLSGAVDAAMEKFDMPMLRGSRVYVDFTNLKCTDAEYVKLALRVRVAQQGATLVDAAEKSDCILEAASGALALEHKSSLVGLPSVPVPQSPMPMPEMPLYKSVEQTGIVKLLLFLHKNGQFLASDQYYAKVDHDESFFLWYRFQREDGVREGWERADLKLEQGRSKSSTTKPAAPQSAAPAPPSRLNSPPMPEAG